LGHLFNRREPTGIALLPADFPFLIAVLPPPEDSDLLANKKFQPSKTALYSVHPEDLL
jgi:hypothetical protein